MKRLGKKARMKMERKRRVEVSEVEKGIRGFGDGIDFGQGDVIGVPSKRQPTARN